MNYRKTRYRIGLDAGNSSVRGVLLKDGRPVDFREWNVLAEGGLEEQEYYDGVAAFLKKAGWENYPVLAGLPQFRCSTLYKVFPSGSGKQLADMVAFETAQLSGVSEERFLNAFCSLPQEAGQDGQPVLIGISREQDINELQQQYLGRKINLSGMSMHGLALLNAFYDLHSQFLTDRNPVLLLDLGHENATVVIAAAGRALFMGTLILAGERFLQALEKCNQVLEKRGERLTPAQVDFANEALHSPLLETARALDAEIQNIVEHWRSQQADEFYDKPVSGIWLSGGGAGIGNLVDWLASSSEVPVRVLAPRWQGAAHPEFTIAYGLALEAGGKALCSLRFLSAELAEKQHSVLRLPFLIAACLFFCLSLFAVEFFSWHHQGRILADCRREYARLDTCGNILPGIQFMYLDLRNREKKILPLVINGRRTHDILKALQVMSEQLSEREWCVYFADYESYLENGPASGIRQKKKTAAGLSANLWENFNAVSDQDFTEFPGLINVESLKMKRSDWIAAGFAPFNESLPYYHVKKLTVKLRKHPLFSNADLFQARNGVDRVEIFLPWVRFLKEKSREYKSFTLLIPGDGGKSREGEE